eukprot:63463-Pelagomonas_calceolata.AAC.6
MCWMWSRDGCMFLKGERAGGGGGSCSKLPDEAARQLGQANLMCATGISRNKIHLCFVLTAAAAGGSCQAAGPSQPHVRHWALQGGHQSADGCHQGRAALILVLSKVVSHVANLFPAFVCFNTLAL